MSNDHTFAAAFSIDGRLFSFQGSVDEIVAKPGSYVALARADGTELLGQVLDMEAVPGGSFAEPLVQGNGSILSDGPGVELSGFTGATLRMAEPELLRGRIGNPAEGGGLEFGDLIDIPGVPAILRAEGFGRHTLLCGQSGSGKTYAAGKILERLLYETELPMVILDPNSDYVGIGEMLSQAESGLSDDGYGEAAARRAQWGDAVKIIGAEQGGGLRLWLGNLTPRQQATVLELDPIVDGEEMAEVRGIAEELGTHRFTPRELRAEAVRRPGEAARRLALRIENLGLDQMEIWADTEHPALGDSVGDGWRALVMDLGSLRTPRERSIVAAAVLSFLWDRRRSRQPVLLMIDEAHNLCPQHPTDPNQAIATEALIAIAGEGRKFGIYLMLATQRPTKIHENILTQCDNLILMRMNSSGDLARLSEAFSMVPTPLIERSGTFLLGEGLAVGKIAPDPLLFKTGRRMTPEGGLDMPANWAHRRTD